MVFVEEILSSKFSRIGKQDRITFLALSEYSSKMFPEYSLQFITEAIKSYRIVEKHSISFKKSSTTAKAFIFDLIVPWLSNVQFELADSNFVLLFLLNLTFLDDLCSADLAWTNIAKSPFAAANIPKLLDIFILIQGSCPQAAKKTHDIILIFANAQPKMVYLYLISR